MKLILIIILSSLFLISCKGQVNEKVQTLSVDLFAKKLKSIDKPQLIDVRSPEEYESEKIENAKNINWNGEDFEANCALLDLNKPVFVYCKVGGRSAKAASKLSTMGFKEIYNLEGGIMKWNSVNPEKSSKIDSKIIGISPEEFNTLLQTDPKIIISFYAKWCEPCHKMQPYIIKMQTELKNKIKIIRFDADENKTILKHLKLDGLPVILIYENGKETFRHIGFMSEVELKKQI